jgi:hypothetical protein
VVTSSFSYAASPLKGTGMNLVGSAGSGVGGGDGAASGVLNIIDNAVMGINNGGTITLGGNYISSGNAFSLTYAGIKGGKENGTDYNSAGYLALYTTPNGASPTERIRITSGGNVGIGTASPASRLSVHGQFRINTSNEDGNENRLFFNPGGAGDPAQLYLYNEAQSNTVYVTANGSSYFNSGNVLIGTTTDAGIKLYVNGGVRATDLLITNDRLWITANRPISDWISSGLTAGHSSANSYSWVNGAGSLVLGSNGTERMRIATNGDIYVSNNAALFFGASALTYVAGGNTSMSFAVNGSERMSIASSGLVSIPSLISTFTTGNAANMFVSPGDGAIYRSTSSIKYKKNVQDYTRGLADVMKLRPVTYEGKSDIDNGKTFAGLIAEEVHDLGLTEFVQYAEDGSPDALSYQNMIALAFKAIQELKAEIEILKTK